MAEVDLFRLPSLGADMEHGTVLEWMVDIGDPVERGDVVAIVDTEKSEIEVEIWQAGVVTEFLVEIGEEVPVGTPLARLSVEGEVEAPSAPPPSAPPPTAPPPAPTPPGAAAAPHPGRVVSPLVRHRAEELGVDLEHLVGTGPREAITRVDVERAAAGRADEPARPARLIAASPKARRLARERGIDLDSLTGSGPGGAIQAADVGESASEARPTAPPSARAAIAALMSRSNAEIPHFHLTLDLDLGPTLAWLSGVNEERSVAERILPAAVLLQAAARAVARHPAVNGFWIDGDFRPGEGVQLGVAVALRGGGLVAPAIADADRLDTDQTMAALRDLVGRARAGRMRSREMSSATITVTNLGDRGVDAVQGVIHPPQVALVGFGQIRERPVVVDGEIMARPTVTATLAGDHRALDGHDGARVLATLDRLLRDPAELNPPPPTPE